MSFAARVGGNLLQIGRSASLFLVGCAVSMVAVAPRADAQIDLTSLGVFKAVDRVDGGAPVDWFFEACAVGSGIDTTAGNEPFVMRPGGATNILVFDGEEYCFEANFGSQGALDGTFTNGIYTFDLKPTNSGTRNQYTVNLNSSFPGAFPDVTTPASGANILDDRDLTVAWALNPVCNPPSSCGDNVVVNFDSGIAETSDVLPIDTTSHTIPAANVASGPGNEVEIETIRGLVQGNGTQNGDAGGYVVNAIYEDVNLIGAATAVARTMDLANIDLFKFHDYLDGVEETPPYGIEGCVTGTGIASAQIDTPSGTQTMTQDADEFCFEEVFASQALLDAAHPSAGEVYTFLVTQTGGAVADIPVVFDEDATGGFPDIAAPAHDSTVPAGQDLNITWALNGTPACVPPSLCGEAIALAVADLAADNDILFDGAIPIADTSAMVSQSLLVDGKDYEIEIETYNGFLGNAANDGSSDAYLESVAWEEVNTTAFTVPEPTAAATFLAAFGALMTLARRRRAIG